MSEKQQENFTETLLSILGSCSETRYGEKFNFAKIKSYAEYKSRVPLSEWKDYEESILMMMAGESNITTNLEPTSFLTSSGTTGKHKFIPSMMGSSSLPASVTTNLNEAYACQRDEVKSICEAHLTEEEKSNSPTVISTLVMNSQGIDRRTTGGKPIGAGSAIMIESMVSVANAVEIDKNGDANFLSGGKHNKSHWQHVTHPLCHLLNNPEQANYASLFFSLCRADIQMICSAFVTNLISWFQTLQKEWPRLVNDVRLGRISGHGEPLFDELNEGLAANNERADELKAIFESTAEADGTLKEIALRIWPKLRIISAICGGNFKSYIEPLRFWTGQDVYDHLLWYIHLYID